VLGNAERRPPSNTSNKQKPQQGSQLLFLLRALSAIAKLSRYPSHHLHLAMARFKKTSARGFVRAVRLTSALRVQADKNHDGSETRHARTDIVGLLKECHRLSLAISINESAAKPIDDQDAKLISYPKSILPWKHFAEVSDNFWEILTEECGFQDQKVSPSSWECDLSLEGSQHVKSVQDFHTFRHLTVHRFISRIWNELVVDENFWRGSYDCLPRS
jgi:hypothetical protein